MPETKVTKVIEASVGKQVDIPAEILEKGKEFIAHHGIDILQALFIMLVGYMFCRWLKGLVRRILTRSHVDASAISFISDIVYFIGLSIVMLIALGVAGVPTTTLAATFGAVGLALSLGLQGNISNVASGIFLLIFRPFRVGDYIAVEGNEGFVQDIRIMYTEIITLGRQLIVIPNSRMTGSIIKNYSSSSFRNLEIIFDVGYDTDLEACLNLLERIFGESAYITNKEGIVVFIKGMASSSIQIYARGEVERSKYYKAQSQIFIDVKNAFDEAGIDIPFPQVVIHEVDTNNV